MNIRKKNEFTRVPAHHNNFQGKYFDRLL